MCSAWEDMKILNSPYSVCYWGNIQLPAHFPIVLIRQHQARKNTLYEQLTAIPPPSPFVIRLYITPLRRGGEDDICWLWFCPLSMILLQAVPDEQKPSSFAHGLIFGHVSWLPLIQLTSHFLLPNRSIKEQPCSFPDTILQGTRSFNSDAGSEDRKG